MVEVICLFVLFLATNVACSMLIIMLEVQPFCSEEYIERERMMLMANGRIWNVCVLIYMGFIAYSVALKYLYGEGFYSIVCFEINIFHPFHHTYQSIIIIFWLTSSTKYTLNVYITCPIILSESWRFRQTSECSKFGLKLSQ